MRYFDPLFISTWTARDWRDHGDDIVIEIVKVDYFVGYAIHYVRASEEKVEWFRDNNMLELLIFNQN